MNDEQTWLIASLATILALFLPLIALYYVQNYDEVNDWFLFYGHERTMISNYRKIVGKIERERKKND